MLSKRPAQKDCRFRRVRRLPTATPLPFSAVTETSAHPVSKGSLRKDYTIPRPLKRGPKWNRRRPNLAGDQKRRFESRPVTSGVLPLSRRSQTHAGLGADGTTSEKGHFQTHTSQQSKPYSITSSALASTDAGGSRPSDLAVFRLTTSSYLVGVCTGRSAGFAPALISAILGHAGAAPTSASSSFKARTKLPGGPRRGLDLSQSGRQMHALLSFTFLDLKCGSASSRAVPPV
jgi:hypothetical protein